MKQQIAEVTKTMRAVLYARVSTRKQKEQGYSLDSQIDGCRKYANEHGFTVVAEISDDCSGTIPVFERQGGARLYDMVDSSEVEAVILYTDDRTERQDDLAKAGMEYLLFKFYLYDHNVQLHYSDTGLDEVSDIGNLFGLLKAQRRSEERRKLKERTHRGRIKKAKNGLVVGNGHMPYGYQYQDGQLVKIERQVQVVEQMYHWCVVDGLSCTAIARELTTLHITTPGEEKGYKRKREPGKWDASVVQRMLTNPVYKGELHYGRTKRAKSKTNPNNRIEQKDPNLIVIINVDPVVSSQVWEAAQKQIEVNKLFVISRMAKKRDYLLRGLIRCGCGSAMTGAAGGSGHLYYRCCAGDHRFIDIEGKTCHERGVRCDKLDSVVWQYVIDVMTDRERFEELLTLAQQQELDTLQPKRKRLELVIAQLGNTELEAEKLAQALITSPGGVVGNILQKQIDDVNRQHAALIKERDTIQSNLETEALTTSQMESAMLFREDVIEGLKDPTFEDKRNALEALRVKVVVKDGQAHISCRIPVPESVKDLRPSYWTTENYTRFIELSKTVCLADTLFSQARQVAAVEVCQ